MKKLLIIVLCFSLIFSIVGCLKNSGNNVVKNTTNITVTSNPNTATPNPNTATPNPNTVAPSESNTAPAGIEKKGSVTVYVRGAEVKDYSKKEYKIPNGDIADGFVILNPITDELIKLGYSISYFGVKVEAKKATIDFADIAFNQKPVNKVQEVAVLDSIAKTFFENGITEVYYKFNSEPYETQNLKLEDKPYPLSVK